MRCPLPALAHLDARALGGRSRLRAMSAYDNVLGGGLKLKGISKKKKKRRSGDDEDEASALQAAALPATAASAASAAESSAAGGLAAGSHLRTTSEQRRLETMAQRTVDKLENGELKSHREKVKDFNSYLSSLTEHYDLPKVSKGN